MYAIESCTFSENLLLFTLRLTKKSLSLNNNVLKNCKTAFNRSSA